MKKTLFASIISLSIAGVSYSATTIGATNAVGGGAGYVQQVLVSGVPYTSGTIMAGTFTTTTGIGSGAIDLASYGWSMFGSAPFSANAIAPGVFGAFMAAGQSAGITDTLPTSETGPFIGNNIFLVIANPENTEFIIWDSNQVFVVEDPVLGGSAVSIQTRNADLLRGTLVAGGNSGLGGPLAGFNGGDAVTFVPEPSVALLGAFGILGLLRRRR